MDSNLKRNFSFLSKDIFKFVNDEKDKLNCNFEEIEKDQSGHIIENEAIDSNDSFYNKLYKDIKQKNKIRNFKGISSSNYLDKSNKNFINLKNKKIIFANDGNNTKNKKKQIFFKINSLNNCFLPNASLNKDSNSQLEEIKRSNIKFKTTKVNEDNFKLLAKLSLNNEKNIKNIQKADINSNDPIEVIKPSLAGIDNNRSTNLNLKKGENILKNKILSVKNKQRIIEKPENLIISKEEEFTINKIISYNNIINSQLKSKIKTPLNGNIEELPLIYSVSFKPITNKKESIKSLKSLSSILSTDNNNLNIETKNLKETKDKQNFNKIPKSRKLFSMFCC